MLSRTSGTGLPFMRSCYHKNWTDRATAILFLATLLSTSAALGQKTQGLSDDYAKAGIKYVVAVLNFESSANTTSVTKAEEKIESAKEDMEAAETAYACDEEIAEVSLHGCPEHLTSVLIELSAFTYVTVVKTNHLDNTAKNQAAQDKEEACINAWKQALQRRDSTQPKACSSK